MVRCGASSSAWCCSCSTPCCWSGYRTGRRLPFTASRSSSSSEASRRPASSPPYGPPRHCPPGSFLRSRPADRPVVLPENRLDELARDVWRSARAQRESRVGVASLPPPVVLCAELPGQSAARARARMSSASGPCELDGEDGEPDEDHEDSRSREHEHQHAGHQYSRADRKDQHAPQW